MTVPLRIRLLGTVQIVRRGETQATRATRSIQTLLAYLLLQPRRAHPRDALAGALWGDHNQQHARSCLNTALWRLRHVLEPRGVPRGTYLLGTPNGWIGFNWDSEHWLDVEDFEERAASALRVRPESAEASVARGLESSVRGYAGELLEGFVEDWAIRERERLRALYLQSLTWLVRFHRGGGALDRSVGYAEEILRLDPLREEIHRELMRLHLHRGARAQAARQYEVCREVLRAELAVEPMEETRALYDEIVDPSAHAIHSLAPPSTARRADSHRSLREAVDLLRAAYDDLQHTKRRVEKALDTVHRLLGDAPAKPSA